jgi:hypothetical protein
MDIVINFNIKTWEQALISYQNFNNFKINLTKYSAINFIISVLNSIYD